MIRMQHTALPHTDIEVAPLVLGGGAFGSGVTGEALDALLDAYHAAGGNWLDSAHCYAAWLPESAGCSERAIGAYLCERGNRDQWVLATKGGHPPFHGYDKSDAYLSPECIADEINDSLGWLGVETIDLYFLHRDDERVPVGEIIDMLNEHIQDRRLRAIGVSNWSCERLTAANTYATEHGKTGFVASQPRWHLAAMAEDLPGDMKFLDEASRTYCRQNEIAIVPYTATAGGAFATGKVGNDIDTPATHDRLARARELAKDLGCTANQIALAWLMCQPQPVFPITGTSDVEHLQEAIEATTIELSPQQVNWLEWGNDVS